MASKAAQLFAASSETEDAAEMKVRKRLDDAVRYVDRQVRKIIAEMQNLCPGKTIGSIQVTYGELFAATQNSMEALSGTLMTAKKRGVVSYDGSLLLQRVHDNVVITLLKDSIPDSPLPDHSKRKQPPLKAGGFAASAGGVEKCAQCQKTVYPAERVGAAGAVYHNTCFRCAHCNKILDPTDFCNLNKRNFCKSDFNMLVSKQGLTF